MLLVFAPLPLVTLRFMPSWSIARLLSKEKEMDIVSIQRSEWACFGVTCVFDKKEYSSLNFDMIIPKGGR